SSRTGGWLKRPIWITSGPLLNRAMSRTRSAKASSDPSTRTAPTKATSPGAAAPSECLTSLPCVRSARSVVENLKSRASRSRSSMAGAAPAARPQASAIAASVMNRVARANDSLWHGEVWWLLEPFEPFGVAGDQGLFPGATPRFQLALAFQGGAERLTWLGVDERDRQPRACVLGALPGVVHLHSLVRVAGEAGVQRPIGAASDVDEEHEEILRARSSLGFGNIRWPSLERGDQKPGPEPAADCVRAVRRAERQPRRTPPRDEPARREHGAAKDARDVRRPAVHSCAVGDRADAARARDRSGRAA